MKKSSAPSQPKLNTEEVSLKKDHSQMDREYLPLNIKLKDGMNTIYLTQDFL